MWCLLFQLLNLLAADGTFLQDPSMSDWLVNRAKSKTTFSKLPGNIYRLSNGLVHRDFIINPNFATIDLYSHEEDTSILRALSPETELHFYGSNNQSIKVGGVLSNVSRGWGKQHPGLSPISEQNPPRSRRMIPTCPQLAQDCSGFEALVSSKFQ